MVDSAGRITLWGIEVFLATAEEGSISAAARRLGASNSSVSQQLTNLETAVSSVLLDRGARPVTLTPAGELFRRRAQVILNETEQVRAELASASLSSFSRFRLGMIEDFDADVTPRLLSQMASELKDSQFLLETGASHNLMELLDTRALDVVVAADLGAAEDWVEVHPLLQEPFVAAVPKGLKNPEKLLEPDALPLIQYTARHMMGKRINDHLIRQNLRLRHRFELDSYHAIMAMVAEGAGWSILTPLGVLRAMRFHNAIDLHPLPGAPLMRTISLSARRDILGKLPEQLAGQLRPLIQELVIEKATAMMPWLSDELRLL